MGRGAPRTEDEGGGGQRLIVLLGTLIAWPGLTSSLARLLARLWLQTNHTFDTKRTNTRDLLQAVVGAIAC